MHGKIEGLDYIFLIFKNYGNGRYALRLREI